MIDKGFIMEQKEIIIDNLKEYSKASDKEIEQFLKKLNYRTIHQTNRTKRSRNLVLAMWS